MIFIIGNYWPKHTADNNKAAWQSNIIPDNSSYQEIVFQRMPREQELIVKLSESSQPLRYNMSERVYQDLLVSNIDFFLAQNSCIHCTLNDRNKWKKCMQKLLVSTIDFLTDCSGHLQVYICSMICAFLHYCIMVPILRPQIMSRRHSSESIHWCNE